MNPWYDVVKMTLSLWFSSSKPITLDHMSSRSSFEETDTPVLLLQTLNVVNRWAFCKSEYIARDPEQLFFFTEQLFIKRNPEKNLAWWKTYLHECHCFPELIFVGRCPLGGTRILCHLSASLAARQDSPQIHGSPPSCMSQLPYLGIYGKLVFSMLCLKAQGPGGGAKMAEE